MERPPGRPNLAWLILWRRGRAGWTDYLGFFAVTAGLGIEAKVASLRRPMTIITPSC
jgi:cobalamin-dependent methionine synthase I